jgi:hypothetical protein
LKLCLPKAPASLHLIHQVILHPAIRRLVVLQLVILGHLKAQLSLHLANLLLVLLNLYRPKAPAALHLIHQVVLHLIH